MFCFFTGSVSVSLPFLNRFCLCYNSLFSVSTVSFPFLFGVFVVYFHSSLDDRHIAVGSVNVSLPFSKRLFTVSLPIC
jgi:hypothetical protein